MSSHSIHTPNVDQTERYISLAAGTILGLVVLNRGWLLTGAAVAALAGGLIYRGATGYCPINNAIGRDTTDLDTGLDHAHPRFPESETLPRSVAEVA